MDIGFSIFPHNVENPKLQLASDDAPTGVAMLKLEAARGEMGGMSEAEDRQHGEGARTGAFSHVHIATYPSLLCSV